MSSQISKQLEVLFIGLGRVGLTIEQINELELQVSKLSSEFNEAKEDLNEWIEEQKQTPRTFSEPSIYQN